MAAGSVQGPAATGRRLVGVPKGRQGFLISGSWSGQPGKVCLSAVGGCRSPLITALYEHAALQLAEEKGQGVQLWLGHQPPTEIQDPSPTVKLTLEQKTVPPNAPDAVTETPSKSTPTQ